MQIRTATETDIPGIVALINKDLVEPTTLESFGPIERHRMSGGEYRRLIALGLDGSIIGTAPARVGVGLKPGHGFIRVVVDPDHRSRGIGGAICAEAEAWVLSQGAKVLESNVKDHDAHAMAWASMRGYEQEYHIYESRLGLAAWDPSPFLGAVRQVESQGIQLTSLAAEMTGDETMRRYYEFQELTHDIPGWEGIASQAYEPWRAEIDANPLWNPAGVILAVHEGRWVGISHVSATPSGTMYNSFTGVIREYRGRGLALPMKVVALNYAKQTGAPYIRTYNHSTNQPMLAVNGKLGYVSQPGLFTLQKQVNS